MKVRKMIIGALCALAVSGCAQTTDRIRSMNWMEVAGTLGGAAIGGYAGAQFGGGLAQTMFTATGVMVGGGIGYIGARMMSQRDQALHNETTHKALASNTPGTPYHWNNPESGHSGMVRRWRLPSFRTARTPAVSGIGGFRRRCRLRQRFGLHPGERPMAGDERQL